MQTRQQWRRTRLALAWMGATACLALQACGGGNAPGRTGSSPEPIEGLWDTLIVALDCDSGSLLGRFVGQLRLHADGLVSDPDAPLVETERVPVGEWARQADGRYLISLQLPMSGAEQQTPRLGRLNSLRQLDPQGQAYVAETWGALDEPGSASAPAPSGICFVDVGARVL